MKKIFLIIVILLLLILSGVIGYSIGSKRDTELPQTFYAKIIEIKNDNFLVEGLAVNDINFRGEFTFSLNEDTILEWRYTEVDKSSFDIGDIISITFDGMIEESYPARITSILKIQLLDDKE